MTTTAADALAELEERVRSGDDTVTAEEVEHARGLARFAELRKVAGERRAAAEHEQQLAAERERALADARQILAEAPADAVAAAEQAAAEAMVKLRQAVRAHNDGVRRALARLQSSPVPASGGQSGPALGWGRPPYSPDRPFLWVDGRPTGPLDEGAVMDRARKAPADRDAAEQEARQRDAAARRIAQDAALWREDRAAFEALPASRRKPALDSLGVDWDGYLQRREEQQLRQAKAV